ncbi:MAG: HAMP domain-containing histidine kinase [Gammaproteobacteria bacterium]|nr:HAMP domain-containing histidine kinase [Gammaproteobacteria bacterium]MBU1646003.1 HAMP domain-containing histidine kinase [Gammaproteobacteria bacterium]MBU1972065.1 HAMP domain-containing histidine kinase [Gammaproteobacteria bacterium]
MSRRHSLRLRVAFAFATLGATLSLLLTLGIWVAAHDVSQRLLDQTLDAELEDYMARRARNPNSRPPATASLHGYLGQAGSGAGLPPALAGLPPGRHEIMLEQIPYRVAIADRGGERHVILFSAEHQRQREKRFLGYLIAGAALMTLLAAVGGRWLAGRVIAPVTELARAVGQAEPEHPPRLAAAAAIPGDEIDELARAFDRYLTRLAAFVERERAFAADASHELRTPLAVIRGAAEVLADDPALGAAQHERVARIERAAAEMLELIDALLLLAREEDSPVEAPCDAVRITADCVERYRPLATARDTSITIDAPAPVLLPVAPALFAIVVSNLVHNAVAHTRAGHVGISLDGAALVVRDSGSGIRAEAIGRVFERNYRGPDSAGAGIGLSLVKRICDRLGWRIDLRSRHDEGTVATLDFRS